MMEDMKRWGIPDEIEVTPLTPEEEVNLLPFCTYLSRQPKVGLPYLKIIPLAKRSVLVKNGIDETFAQQETGKILRDLSQGRKQGIDAKLKFTMSYGEIFLNEEATELVETKYLTPLLRAGYRISAW